MERSYIEMNCFSLNSAGDEKHMLIDTSYCSTFYLYLSRVSLFSTSLSLSHLFARLFTHRWGASRL